jgi:hypothetical protein
VLLATWLMLVTVDSNVSEVRTRYLMALKVSLCA